MDLRSFLQNRMPYYYHENDTYKDGDGKGILIRFLGILGVEIQEEFVEYVLSRIDQLNPETVMEKYLSIMAPTVGNPSNIIGTDESLRERILQAISLYKIKGTVRSYQLLFNLLGYEATIIEHIPPRMRYDTGLNYDDSYQDQPHHYDRDWCNLGCIDYSIHYSDGITVGSMTPEMVQTVTAAIKIDLEPLNAKLKEIKYI